MVPITAETKTTTGATHTAGFRQFDTLFRVQSLPLVKAVGGPRCGHSFVLWISWERLFCGLCFLRDGYHAELPGKLHSTKVLADNGKPQQTGRLESHVQVIEGIFAPKPGQSLEAFRRVRNALETKPAKNQFPFASSLWDLMGKQPPLAIPLVRALHKPPEEVARDMELSSYNVYERLMKGVRAATDLVRKYDEKRYTS